MRTIDRKLTSLQPFESFLLFFLGGIWGVIVRHFPEKFNSTLKLETVDNISHQYIEAVFIPLVLFEVVHEIDVRTFTHLFFSITSLVLLSFGEYYS